MWVSFELSQCAVSARDKPLSLVQHAWADLQNATGALHRHPATLESSGAQIVTRKSLPTCPTVRSTRLLRCDTGRLCRHHRHIFSRCMRPALVLPIVDTSPPCAMHALLRLLGLPPARCGGRLLRLVSFGQLVGVGSDLKLYSAGRKVLRQTVQVWEGTSCDARFWCSVPSRFHCGPPATAGSRSYVHIGCCLPVGHRSTFFVISLSSFISLSLRPFLYFLGFMSLRSSAVALEFSVIVLLSNHRDCRAEVVMFTRFLLSHFGG